MHQPPVEAAQPTPFPLLPHRPVPRPVPQARPRVAPPVPADVLTILVSVRRSSGVVAWAIAERHGPDYGPARIAAERAADDGGIGQLVAAVAAVARSSDPTREDDRRIVTNDDGLATALRSQEWVCSVDVIPTGALFVPPEVSRSLLAAWRDIVGQMPPLEIACDGSWSRSSHRAGWGVLAADGTYAYGSFTGAHSPTDAEIQALIRAVRLVDQRRRLVIRTDSKFALHYLHVPQDAPASCHSALVNLRELLKTREVTFTWVRGHTGPGLHDGADRLALLARRCADAHLDRTFDDPRALAIVTESLAAHRDADSRMRQRPTPARSGQTLAA